ncbi:hypothetical protein [Methylobacterium sp. OT2]|uniref:hypothetical protein n=1 Tax=Methylobacterium sp. OT2 TaxID=2813779 RepID=UPI00197C5F8B|nr:hypothetical protein [Methylobacterium sp. OT2]MBN4092699.1 hypothetical protein [Methylobacterium sp. OT2]
MYFVHMMERRIPSKQKQRQIGDRHHGGQSLEVQCAIYRAKRSLDLKNYQATSAPENMIPKYVSYKADKATPE